MMLNIVVVNPMPSASAAMASIDVPSRLRSMRMPNRRSLKRSLTWAPATITPDSGAGERTSAEEARSSLRQTREVRKSFGGLPSGALRHLFEGLFGSAMHFVRRQIFLACRDPPRVPGRIGDCARAIAPELIGHGL